VLIMFELENLVRENVRRLAPYSSARKEFSGAAQIYLDANENSIGSPLAKDYSRYPDPLQTKIKERIASMQNVAAENIFIGNGSDEAIDLLFRIFCDPRRDNCLICPPTYGMYEVSAAINDVEIKRAKLKTDFQLDLRTIEQTINADTKLIFLCSPNNPTGNDLKRLEMMSLLKNFKGIVAVDEAYIHFSESKSMVEEIAEHPNLVVLQTFSKAWGLAGLRVGLAYASAEIIRFFNKVKPPYNISQATQEAVLQSLDNKTEVGKNILRIIEEREKLIGRLQKISIIKKIYPTDANFILVKTADAGKIHQFLLDEKIVVRNRTNIALCADCLRITIGTPEENRILLEALGKYEKSFIY
jgi:histidinol-phosphate aminotransferase